jgi:AcrR family transcriptional regulator
MADRDRTDDKRGARGRKPTFDRDETIGIALNLFWRHGYEGVSIGDLCEAIGIAPPSLYHAFGSKAGLYRAALRQYGVGYMTLDEIGAAPSACSAVQSLLERGVEAVTRPGRPLGCLVSSGMLMVGPDHAGLAAELRALRAGLRQAIERRIAQDVASGILPASVDASALARFYATVLQGLSAQAIDGATREELTSTAAIALRAWPR